MFEQSLYEQPQDETPIEVQQDIAPEEGGLFSAYEIKSWSLGPRIYKILGISAVFNLLAVAIFTQGSLMTMKGCDSPLVGSVCKVLDTVYVGAVLFGTKRDMIDQDYEKTELANATMVFTEMPPESEKISYPEGYFAVADPIAWQAKIDALNALNNPTEFVQPGYLAPGIPNNNSTIGIPTTSPYNPGRSILDTPANRPNPNKGKVDPSKLPPGIGDEDDTATVKVPGGKPNGNGVRPNGANPATDANASKPKKPKFDPNSIPEVESKEDSLGVVLNKRPLDLFAAENLPRIEEISPDTNFSVTISGELGRGKDRFGKDIGTIVLQNVNRVSPTFKDKKSEEMAKLAIDGLLALGDSGRLGYLHKVGARKVLIQIQQNASDFKVVIRGDQVNEADAQVIARGLGGLLDTGKLIGDEDTKLLLNAAETTSEGKAFVLRFSLPTPTVYDLIKKTIEKTDKKDGNAGPKVSNSQNLGE